MASASLDTYAVMVAADRDLRLAGYEVFRFGANEVVGGSRAYRVLSACGSSPCTVFGNFDRRSWSVIN
jgi:hypothetical protein